MSRRSPVVAANWKMNFLRRDAEDFSRRLKASSPVSGLEIVIFPPATLLTTVADNLAGSSIAWGGQDLHHQPQGAFTGDISAAQLADVGCTWCLCGHSERRRDHGESDSLVGRKAKTANNHGLVPLICLGESKEERQSGKTFDVLRNQLESTLDAAGDSLASFELAYEPVWAIGTGETATPEIAQETHAFLRQLLTTLFDNRRAETIRILYGGSANPKNVDTLIAQNDIDGFLIGGASLDSEKFLAMISACASTI